jgi:MFS family permease
LFCIWINSHGSWPIGMALLGIFIGSGLVEGEWGHAYATRWTAPQRWKLLGAAGASAAALFINPFGVPLVTYPFRIMFGTGTGVDDIQEFASVNFHAPWGKVAMILILGVLLIAVFSEVRWRLDEVAVVMLAFYYALTFSRFIFLAGILLPPIFARRLKLMEPYDRSSDKRLNNAMALVVLLGLFAASAPRASAFRSPVQYPQDAVAYMKTNRIQGRVFHEYVWGGYLIWHMPALKVFVDGRYDPYGPNGVFKDYMAVISGEKSQALLDKYRVDYVLMPADSVLVQILKDTPKWSVRYSDKTSVLLQRSPSS